MALDGIFLSLVKKEIEAQAVGSRVEKVHQPSREEIVLYLRSRNGAKKLLLSAKSDSPRVCFTDFSLENPPKPPMFCMLMRKYMTSALLTGVRQIENDRIIFLDFDASNEIGDRIKISLCIEIMHKYSNIILLDEVGKIIDSIKRVDLSKSSVRQILPSLQYQLPPAQNKLNLFENSTETIVNTIKLFPEKALSSAILNTIQGVSPIVCRELAYRICFDDIKTKDIDEVSLTKCIEFLKETVKNSAVPTVIYDADNKPIDFTFFDIRQYGDYARIENPESFNNLLDNYFYERDRLDRTHQKAQDLVHKVTTTIQRVSKKLELQRLDLEKCADRESLRINAELISANLYRLQKGCDFYEVDNYYTGKNVKIPVNPALTPNENSQKYYKEYKKAKTAEGILIKLIEDGEAELQYLETVSDLIDRADTTAELDAIRQELIEGSYLKPKGRLKSNSKALPPLEYVTDDGFKILVGRNNVQNDKLSLKTANKNDMWLHTQKIPGSHVIIVAENKEISDLAIEQAASVAAYHSKARGSKIVTVDYTLVKNLKKPVGAKPGKVIYNMYYSINVNTDDALRLIKRI